VVGVGSGGHTEDDVQKRSGLCYLPVDTGGGLGRVGGCGINDKVSDLSVEVVLVGVPVATGVSVRVGINNSHSSKVWQSRDRWWIDCVTNKLGHIILDDRARHSISSLREVDQSGPDGGRVTSLTTSSKCGDSSVDGGSVIGDTVSLSSKALYVTVYLVCAGVLVERSHTVVSDIFDPKLGRRGRADGRAQ